MENNLTSQLHLLVGEKYNGSWNKLAKASGIRASTLQGVKEGGGMHSDKLLQLSVKTEVMVDWLLTGEGPMYRKEGTGEEEDLVYITHYNVDFAAGWGQSLDDIDYITKQRAFSKKWIKRNGLEKDKLAIVRVVGDSMQPLLRDKDVVMLNLAQKKPVTTMPLAFRMEQMLYIKMCQRDGQGKLQMISINKDYPPILIDEADPPADFEIIGPVVWHAHSWI